MSTTKALNAVTNAVRGCLKARRGLLGALLAVSAPSAVAYSQVQESPVAGDTAHIRDRDRWVLERLCKAASDNCSESTVKKFGYRFSRYRPSLRRGDKVRPYSSAPSDHDLQCWNRCSLYFLDLKPGAHFAHPTVVGVYDRVTGNLQTATGEWWPVINGERHVFDTVRSRIRGSITQQAGQFGQPDVRTISTPTVLLPEVSVIRPGPDPGVFRDTGVDACDVRAVVVNGFKDDDDTFDNDADGMYQVLRGLGVPDDHIVFVSPYDAPHRDYETSLENVEGAIESVADAASLSSCEEFVFMLSSHGGTHFVDGLESYYVELKSRSENHKKMYGAELAALLSTVNCRKFTVIVEACKSGRLKDLIIGALPEGKQVRMLLSAGHNESSWADIDVGDSNPEDLGSETIWGYIEAFGTGRADTTDGTADPNLRISFSEAMDYAKEVDASWVNRDHDPWSAIVVGDDPTDTTSAHSCCSFDANADLFIPQGCLLTGREKSVPVYGMSKVVPRCTNAPISITVKNQGGSTIPVGTLRLHGSVISQGGGMPSSYRPYANLVLLTDLIPGEERTYKVHWGVRPTFHKGDRIALLATVDSPVDPVQPGVCLAGGPGIAACQADQQSCLCEVSIIKRCFPIVGCNCKTYVGPDPPEE